MLRTVVTQLLSGMYTVKTDVHAGPLSHIAVTQRFAYVVPKNIERIVRKHIGVDSNIELFQMAYMPPHRMNTVQFLYIHTSNQTLLVFKSFAHSSQPTRPRVHSSGLLMSGGCALFGVSLMLDIQQHT